MMEDKKCSQPIRMLVETEKLRFFDRDRHLLDAMRKVLIGFVGYDQTGAWPGYMRLAWLMRTNVKTVKRLMTKLNWLGLVSYINEGQNRVGLKVDFDLYNQLDQGRVSYEQLLMPIEDGAGS